MTIRSMYRLVCIIAVGRSSILAGYVRESLGLIHHVSGLGGPSNQAGTEYWIKYDDSGLKQIGSKHRSECYLISPLLTLRPFILGIHPLYIHTLTIESAKESYQFLPSK
jgi:hypothetical protein